LLDTCSQLANATYPLFQNSTLSKSAMAQKGSAVNKDSHKDLENVWRRNRNEKIINILSVVLFANQIIFYKF
jgi:hypothetical protein